MKSITVTRPDSWEDCNVYTLADLHIGDPNCNITEVYEQINRVVNDPVGVCILNGDLCNTALKSSVSDVYSETMTPMKQIMNCVELLRPIADKIIGVTSGNHENRVMRNDGIDMTRLICRELGIEDLYCPEGMIIFLRFGTTTMHGKHSGAKLLRCYSIMVVHGSGGGRKEGAKAIRLADMACIADADIYIHSHTHLPMIMKQGYFRVSNCSFTCNHVDKLFVNTGASLDYGGYGQTFEYKPSSIVSPVIHLNAKHRKMSATM